MADKKATEEKPSEKAKDAKPEGKKKAGRAKKAPIFMIGSILMAAVFLPSSVLLGIGMLPTFAALFAEKRYARTKIVTVGALNLAGCFPFLLDLWSQGHTIDNALKIVSSPQAIIVMYAAAAIGYMVDWAMSIVVAGILYQRGLARQQAILKRQAELSDRWGAEVTGQVPLDHLGFPVHAQPKH